MHDIQLNGFLDILMGIWGYMTSHGFNITISGQTFSLTYAVVMMGIFCMSCVIGLIHKIWWDE